MENLDQPSVESNATMTVLRRQLGEILMSERLSQKKDTVDVARRLMLSKQQLLAIEAGEAASFHHERRYIQGIKSYVFYLGLQSRMDVESFLKQIEDCSAEALRASPAAGVAQLHRAAATPANTKPYSSRNPRYVYLGLALLVLGAVALAISEGWPFKGSNDEVVSSESTPSAALTTEVSNNTQVVPTPAPPMMPQSETSAQTQASTTIQAPSQVQPSPSPPVVDKSIATEKPAPAVASGAPGIMRIDFNAECWMSVQTIDGKKIDRIYKQGESFSMPVANVSAMILGNAPAAKVFFGTRQVDIMSKGLAQGNVSRLDQKSLQLLQKN
ncbi:MAG: RodZ domain-containing protein [Zwartia sp.]|uniref:helix-turn-helix domain-containing protein n=2 Tax=Zwartia sp. TaxID=2978004 RepID=UPI003C763027